MLKTEPHRLFTRISFYSSNAHLLIQSYLSWWRGALGFKTPPRSEVLPVGLYGVDLANFEPWLRPEDCVVPQTSSVPDMQLRCPEPQYLLLPLHTRKFDLYTPCTTATGFGSFLFP